MERIARRELMHATIEMQWSRYRERWFRKPNHVFDVDHERACRVPERRSIQDMQRRYLAGMEWIALRELVYAAIEVQ